MEKTNLRTTLCANVELTKEKVSVCGWVNSIRDHGGILFIDLRDYSGLVQVVADPKNLKNFKEIESLRREDCIKAVGTVRERAKDLVNKKLKTGHLEIVLQDFEIFSKSDILPFEIDDKASISEDFRLKYRYLDLRRPLMQKRIRQRSNAMQNARKYLTQKEEFAEIETPFLIRSTPEGARDYVVPSRVNKHKFYALPQSPQLYKQLLMVGGFDRYFQFVKCFRDEDLRSDRQPEFTQLDLELSFIEKEDVFRIVENLLKEFGEVYNIKIPSKVPRMSFKEAMEKYSIDKPDTRFELFTYDVTDLASKSEFGVFLNTIKDGGIVKCINPEKDFSRNELDRYIENAKQFGAKGMAWVKVKQGEFEGNISKFIQKDVQKQIIEKIGAKENSTIMFIADKKATCLDVIGRLRLKVGDDLDLIDKTKYNFLWVVDFPLFEETEDGSLTPSHHMFTMPQKEHIKLLDENPGEVLAEQYDLVLNGFELAGGSIRCHRKDVQKKIMNIIGFPEEKAKERFGFLLEAFEFGVPPHGGIAFGFDRVCALMSGTNDIREVMTFPKNKKAQCTMDGSPSDIQKDQLDELHIKLK